MLHWHAGKKVFGAPLSSNVRQYGQALPPVILNALRYLREGEGEKLKLLGLFRRAASKARVDRLREMAEADPGEGKGKEKGRERERRDRRKSRIDPLPKVKVLVSHPLPFLF